MKPTQDFTAQNLFWMKGRRVPESLRKHAPTTKESWLQLAERIEEKIARGTFRFTGIFASKASGKPALSTSSSADALVLRKINSNIRRAYGIRQVQRANAVSLARTALAEWTPKGIISLDLKSCFESITPRNVTEKLRKEAKVSSQTIHLLELFLSQARNFGANKYARGLPRGILVSSTLAELYLKELDDLISLMPGVYLYIRYVDDILVMVARQSKPALKEINELVSKLGLTLNSAKSRTVDAGCKCAFECSHKIGKCPCNNKCSCTITPDNFDFIDYLGYRLIFSTGSNLKKSPECYAMISKMKSDRTKKRVSAAISMFRKTGNFPLLADSLRYLTSNVTIDKSLKQSTLSSGIAYTYDQYAEPPAPHRFGKCSLKGLDIFLRTKLRRLFSKLPLSYMQRRALLKNSFEYGHKNKHRASFTRLRSSEIRRVWTHEKKKD